MNIYTYSVKKIGNDKLLRQNVKTAILEQKIALFNSDKMIRIKELFDVISGFAFSSSDYVNEGVPLVRIGDLNGDKLDFISMAKLPSEFYEDSRFDRYKIKKDDILVSLTGDGKLKCAHVDRDIYCLLNQRVAILRKKSDKIITKFYYWILQTGFVKNQFAYYSNGKSQLNISPFDFANIKLPFVDDDIQRDIMNKIIPIEAKVEELGRSMVPVFTIIDCVFNSEFGFDFNAFEDLVKSKKYTINQSLFSNNVDLRFSAKFHRPAGVFVIEQLAKITNKRIKNFLAEPIVLGASVSPSDYSDEGRFKYISMATIKNWYFDGESASIVSDEYADSKKSKTVKKNDIIMARSGEGTIGKVALITGEDINGIFADFTMRIRLKNYNPEFAYYYLRTTYFQYLVEIYKKGLGNNTNIFPNVIQELPIPDISLKEQARIVNLIQSEIEVQDNIRLQITSLRTQINELVEKTISKRV